MTGAAERDARRALARLRRAVEKTARELETAENALRALGGDPLPAQVFEEAANHLLAVGEFIDEQAERLEARILEAGGLDPERLRRDGGD
ncbi:MAG TPA: hypothetical protein VF212_00470 [Longimicrobiales bacterium]